MSTYKEIANDLELWREHHDTGATMSEEVFNTMSEEEKIASLVECHGEEEARYTLVDASEDDNMRLFVGSNGRALLALATSDHEAMPRLWNMMADVTTLGKTIAECSKAVEEYYGTGFLGIGFLTLAQMDLLLEWPRSTVYNFVNKYS